MGHISGKSELSNPRKCEADTGALMLCIPEHLALQLDLDSELERDVSVADGGRRRVPYVGPVKMAFKNRSCCVGALVLNDEVLLDAVPMEDMDLTISPARRELAVDPRSPGIPYAPVKTLLTTDN